MSLPNLKKTFVFISLIFLVWAAFLPLSAFSADVNPEETPGSIAGSGEASRKSVFPGLVPCGNITDSKTGITLNPCTPCHVYSLIENVLNFIWKWIAIPLAALMLVYGGFLMLVPGVGGEKSAGALTKGKQVITRALVGLLLIFIAWLAIDTIIKILVDPNQLGSGKPAEIFKPWNTIDCASPVPPGQLNIRVLPTPVSNAINWVISPIAGPNTPSYWEQTQIKDLIKKYPGAFSTNGDCGGNNADTTMRAIAGGSLPPVCSPNCVCRTGGITGKVDLDPSLVEGMGLTLNQFKGKIQVESLTTGVHNNGSLHYQGRAVDYKITDKSLSYLTLFAFLIKSPDVSVQCEIPGSTGAATCTDPKVNHIHVQYKK